MTPRRIQRQRTRGWRMPENTIYVGRPTIYGNPWPLDVYRREFAYYFADEDELRRYALREYRGWITGEIQAKLPMLELPERPDLTPLRGRNLACWCPDGQPCHADILLELANRAA